MITSPLQLDRYFFERLAVEAAATQSPPEAHHDVRVNVGVTASNENPHRWRITLDISVVPRDGQPPPNYLVEARVVGFLTDVFEDTMPDRDNLVAINGASLLFSAAREMILLVTSRGPWPGYKLPTVRFQRQEPPVVEEG